MNLRKQFNNFIENNLDNAYRFAYSYLKNQADAEDVVSESVVKALKSISQLKNPDYMKTWFFSIIANTAKTHYKNNKKITYLDSEIYDSTVGKEDDYSHINLESMLKILDEELRSIVILRFFEDMKISDIALILSQNENTIKTKLYKALKILKEDMEDKNA